MDVLTWFKYIQLIWVAVVYANWKDIVLDFALKSVNGLGL